MTALTDIIGMDTQPWMERGFCADSAFPDTWFPTEGGETRERAEALCGGCPVRIACLRYALADSTLEGIWGGTTSAQRRTLRRDNTEGCGTYGGYLSHLKLREKPCEACRAINAEASRRKRRANRAA